MRPRLFTVRNFLLFVVAMGLLGGSAYWVKQGMPLPGGGVPSTAGKIAFISDRSGKPDLWITGDDGSGAVSLTHDDATDRSPVWSPNGSELAFISESRANDVNPQVYLMDAIAGAKVVKLTRTDSPKDAPHYAKDGRIFFLDAGKVSAANADGTDTDALLPNHEQRGLPPTGHADLFAAGGFSQMMPSPDGKHIAAVMHTERGDALVLYDTSESEEALYLLGIAEQIRFSFLPDGGIAAVFNGSQPFPQPLLLFSKATDTGTLPQDQLFLLQNVRNLIVAPDEVQGNMRPPQDSRLHFVIVFDATGKAYNGLPVQGVVPDGVTASPDGTKLLLTSEGKNGGVSVVDLQAKAIAEFGNKPSRDGAWSPDGKQFAYVSGPDIFVASLDGGEGATKNLTKGQGQNSSPVWSPTLPATKK